MRALVYDKMLRFVEFFTARFAFEEFLCRVCTAVPREKIVVLKGFSARFALEVVSRGVLRAVDVVAGSRVVLLVAIPGFGGIRCVVSGSG